MSPINVVIPSPSGYTAGIAVIIKLIKDYPDNLIQVLHLYKQDPEDDSTFIAFFREPNSIGKFTAVINAWGTSYGYSGEGPRAYGAIRSVIEECQLNFKQCEWQDFLKANHECEGRPFKKWQDEPESTISLIKQWEELLTERCYFSLCRSLPLEPYTFDHFNKYWKSKWGKWDKNG
jgi:hypothetical protein